MNKIKVNAETKSASGKRMQFFSASPIQTKLKVNTPGDKFEKEADEVSKIVLKKGNGEKSLDSSPTENPNFGISKKGLDSLSVENQIVPKSVENTLRKSGMGLNLATISEMEASFGEDFKDVRIHTDDAASRSAGDINARAYTFKNDIVFGENEYKPNSFEGKKLLAHELVHVMQQKGNYNTNGGGLIQRTTRTFIEGGIRGHGSPRWEHRRGGTSGELNLVLSRQRANTVENLFQEMFRREMMGHGDVEFAISSSVGGERDAEVISVPSEAIGDRETLIEAGGDRDANELAMRRVDINVVVTRQEEGEAPHTEPLVIPEECEANATNQWAIKLTLSGGGGHAGLGGAFAIGQLKNRRTGQIAEGSFLGGGIGVGLQTPGADPGWGDWTNFTTEDICTFEDFNNTLARLTTAGAGAFVGYGMAWISFPMRGVNSIYVGGFNAGAVGIDASSNVGNWNVHGTPPGPICRPEETVATQGLTPFTFDIQDSLRHTVYFETGSSELDDAQFQRLHEFVQHITARYNRE